MVLKEKEVIEQNEGGKGILTRVMGIKCIHIICRLLLLLGLF